MNKMNNYFLNHINLLTHYQRYKTRVVNIGNIPLGGNNPVRIQSMTNTDTMNTDATVAQAIRLVESGCEYVRITAPSIKEANNLAVIKSELAKRGYLVPLIADIHFVPRAAEVAARLVEKVRINPGNYVDRRKFLQQEYSESEYQTELDRIRERFTPLVKICREEGTAMRIGSNHGSLSDRILNQYGDTPMGMVESAMEFVRICADENFHELVISMKASNTRVMIQAYRLLVDRMENEGFNYPLHLGVTEAGDGADGRLKSALGIGSLLLDGFGDTIRVSLTEAPEAEIPVAFSIVKSVGSVKGHSPIRPLDQLPINLFGYTRRVTNSLGILGGGQVPVVVADLSNGDFPEAYQMNSAGYQHDPIKQVWESGDQGADILIMNGNPPKNILLDNALILCDSATWINRPQHIHTYPLYDRNSFSQWKTGQGEINFVRVNASVEVTELPDDPSIVWILHSDNIHRSAETRRFILSLVTHNLLQPVIVHFDYGKLPQNDLLLSSAAEIGGLLNDGLVDGLWIESRSVDLSELTKISFGILQASRSRMTKTEYIACPSCGRTLFDLEDVTAQIRKRTAHLKGVKIGIMGCIVNGPGEMADADFGYVGTGPGRVSLYRGQEVVGPHIPQEEAVESLIKLIKKEGFWIDP